MVAILRRAAVGAIILAVLFILSAAIIVVDGMTDEVQAADVAIVPGNAVERDGRPSPRLQARLDKAIELYNAGWFPRVIVSGGVGKAGYDEAAVMKAYLVEHGIPAGRIYVDRAGANTYLTAQNAARRLQAEGLHSALVITQYFHVPRARLALARFGVRPVYSAHAEFFEPRDIYSTAREVVALCAYLLRAYEQPQAKCPASLPNEPLFMAD